MSKKISVEQLKKHCGVSDPKRKLAQSRYLKEFKNVTDPIDEVISICGTRAQAYIEDNLEGWYPGIFHLLEVRYKQGDDESLLLMNFRPNKYFETDSPRVLVIFRRIGIDKENDSAGVEEFYLPFNDVDGELPVIHYGVGDQVSPYEVNEHSRVGYELYREAMGIELELKDLN